ncbi:DUF5064 family protein [Pseudomonas aeruginosa]|uniref:DUF5064 family protein n=1 Tax=Pseudomonas aeruginosa TaxID=287 RepID=UPI000E2EDBED|nr:DUF5064 family protein [Pseudomonas aeruginosa]
MFIPGHLHLASASEVDRQAFDIHLRYRVLEAEARPVAVHFDMEGRIDGQPFSESFELPRDAAVHFASRASRLRLRQGPIVRQRREYDAMFDDLRRRLKLKSGEAIDLDRYLRGEAGAS